MSGKCYYWRQYGNNYPCLFQCSEAQFKANCEVYGLRVGPTTGAVNRGYYFYDRNGQRYFHWHTFEHPYLKYCGDTYFYGYFRSEDISNNGKFQTSQPHHLRSDLPRPLCYKGHRLYSYKTPGGNCDKCGCYCGKDTEVFDCRQCNYWVCKDCCDPGSVVLTFSVLCIGSAGSCKKGHAKLAPTNKADGFGLLDVEDDIKDCKWWIQNRCDQKTWELYGVWECAGRSGTADSCKQELQRFFNHCKRTNLTPVIYYTGHGDEDGDWMFPDGGYITLSTILDMNQTGWKPVIWSDCCYSGQWAELANGRAKVVAASAKDKCARNRVFARAMFRDSKEDEQRLMQDDISAVSTDGYQARIVSCIAGWKSWLMAKAHGKS